MRQPTAALAVAVICLLVAGCGSTIGNAESPTTTRSMIPRPLVERELAGLLLSPEQVNVAMGAAGMTVTNNQTSMSDNSATMAPQECLAIDRAAEAPVYANGVSMGWRPPAAISVSFDSGLRRVARCQSRFRPDRRSTYGAVVAAIGRFHRQIHQDRSAAEPGAAI